MDQLPGAGQFCKQAWVVFVMYYWMEPNKFTVMHMERQTNS